MTFAVRELPKARQDKDSIFSWLNNRSPNGALTWLSAYDAQTELLKHNALSLAIAPESTECDVEVRQCLFKTRRGRVYRILFMVEERDVLILRVRGPGQASIEPADLE